MLQLVLVVPGSGKGGRDGRGVAGMGPTKRRMGAHWTAWTRIEAHGRARRHMDAHDGERTRSSRSGLQSRDAETLSKKLLMTTHVNATRNGAAWTRTPANGNVPSAWTRIAICNAMQWTILDAALSQGGLRNAAVLPYT